MRFLFATVGPHDVVYIPAGWLQCQTVGSAADIIGCMVSVVAASEAAQVFLASLPLRVVATQAITSIKLRLDSLKTKFGEGAAGAAEAAEAAKKKQAEDAAAAAKVQEEAARQKQQEEAAAAAKRKEEELAKQKQAEEAAAGAKTQEEAAKQKQAEEAAAAAKKQEEEAANQKQAEEAAAAAKGQGDDAARQKQAEEAAAAAKKQEEEAAAAAKKQEEAAAAAEPGTGSEAQENEVTSTGGVGPVEGATNSSHAGTGKQDQHMPCELSWHDFTFLIVHITTQCFEYIYDRLPKSYIIYFVLYMM